ncbi:bromo adjacent homology domain-containing 1 protein isoform X2 [Brachyhypopomus gauderio]
MTQARKKGSLNQCHGHDLVDGWSHGKTMGRPWPERCSKERSVLKGVARKGKQKGREHMEGWVLSESQSRDRLEHSLKKGVTKKGKARVSKKRREERNRKLYPLRGRSCSPEAEPVGCHVLLTRLQERGAEQGNNLNEDDLNAGRKRNQQKKSVKPNKKLEKPKESLHMPSKTMSEATVDKTPAQEPRKRRLASLNAEAVNSLLLEKSDTPLGSKLAKRHLHEVPPTGSADHDAKICFTSKRATQAHRTEECQIPRQAEKGKVDECNDDALDLYTPTPRRLAGLNAAALLKLTSSTTGTKQRAKSDGKGACVVGRQASRCRARVRQPKALDFKSPPPRGRCAVCKSRTGLESRLKWEGATCHHHLTKPGYQSRSMMGYPLKVVKEEQVEAELSPYYCCSPEDSMEYCHRLALFLGQKAYSETDEHPMTSVKHECLVPPSSLAHPALTLSAHPCLCADPCYSSYYVHITHPGPPSASLSAQPLPCAHSNLCPSRVPRSKLLSSSMPHASGIPHPAFCSSVGSPCFGESCRVGSYAFSAMQPVTSRACSYATGCSNCSHQIKTEGYSSPQGDHASSLLAAPALPLSACPVPRLSPSSTAVPRLLSALPDSRRTQVRHPRARECPQSTKPPSGSIAVGRRGRSQKQPTSSPVGGKQTRRGHRHRATNGWRPFGEPAEREVFIAGEDETALRQCYEGVERDGEVIRVRDTVLLRSGPRKKSLPYVAKISALWDDPKTGELMMSLFWYYRPEHTQGGRDPSMHCENEIFASRHQDENSVACIEDRCYVLPLAQYCRFCALVKRRLEGVPESGAVVPRPSDSAIPSHRLVPEDVDPELVYLCRHVYDFRYGRILKNLQ